MKPSELVGSVWTKDAVKHQTSPNLLKLIKHSNTITYWFMQNILDMMNLEERVAVLSRIVDVLMVGFSRGSLLGGGVWGVGGGGCTHTLAFSRGESCRSKSQS